MRVQCVRNTQKTPLSSVRDRNRVRGRNPFSVGMPITVKRNVQLSVPEIVSIIRRVVIKLVREVVLDLVPEDTIAPRVRA